jgi:hypothetical protein
MEKSTNNFRYAPLNSENLEIRLLKLHPSTDFRAVVCCELSHVSLNEYPLYEPLSYTWGDPTVTENISLNGQSFAVTSNLRSALKHLRLLDEPRWLWVDAICIDQLDVLEQNLQVRQMRAIYENAPKTLVWLGDEDDSGIALRYLKRIDSIYHGNETDDMAPDRPGLLRRPY